MKDSELEKLRNWAELGTTEEHKLVQELLIELDRCHDRLEISKVYEATFDNEGQVEFTPIIVPFEKRPKCTDAVAIREIEVQLAKEERQYLVREVARCHARLEITHYTDGTGKRRKIPLNERHDFPDAVYARDETIRLLQEKLDGTS